MIHFVGHDQFAIEPSLVAVDTSQTKFSILFFFGVEFCGGINDASLFIRIECGDVDCSIFTLGGLVDPLGIHILAIGHKLAFVLVFDFSVDPIRFDRKDLVKVHCSNVVEWSDQFPFGQEAELFDLIDNRPFFLEYADDANNLFGMACRVQERQQFFGVWFGLDCLTDG